MRQLFHPDDCFVSPGSEDSSPINGVFPPGFAGDNIPFVMSNNSRTEGFFCVP